MSYGEEYEYKKGHICCFCCCDSRRAVIITDIIGLIVYVLSVTALIIFYSVVVLSNDADKEEFWDNKEDWNTWNNSKDEIQKAIIVVGVFAAIGLVCTACSLVGAVTFRSIPVVVNCIYITVNFIAGGVMETRFYDNIEKIQKLSNQTTDNDFETTDGYNHWLSGIVISLLLLYPHATYCWEVFKGIMSRETYRREEHSCCCV